MYALVNSPAVHLLQHKNVELVPRCSRTDKAEALRCCPEGDEIFQYENLGGQEPEVRLQCHSLSDTEEHNKELPKRYYKNYCTSYLCLSVEVRASPQ